MRSPNFIRSRSCSDCLKLAATDSVEFKRYLMKRLDPLCGSYVPMQEKIRRRRLRHKYAKVDGKPELTGNDAKSPHLRDVVCDSCKQDVICDHTPEVLRYSRMYRRIRNDINDDVELDKNYTIRCFWDRSEERISVKDSEGKRKIFRGCGASSDWSFENAGLGPGLLRDSIDPLDRSLRARLIDTDTSRWYLSASEESVCCESPHGCLGRDASMSSQISDGHESKPAPPKENVDGKQAHRCSTHDSGYWSSKTASIRRSIASAISHLGVKSKSY